MIHQFVRNRHCIDITREVDVSPPLAYKEAYDEWKKKSLASMKPKEENKEIEEPEAKEPEAKEPEAKENKTKEK